MKEFAKIHLQHYIRKSPVQPEYGVESQSFRSIIVSSLSPAEGIGGNFISLFYYYFFIKGVLGGENFYNIDRRAIISFNW